MRNLPTGTVTFLFTDIEASTELLNLLGDEAYGKALSAHHQVLQTAFEREQGQVVDTQGDAFFVAFPRAWNAVAAAVAAQKEVFHHPWPSGVQLRIRIGIHTGEPVFTGNRYVGLDVHRAARVMAAGHGGQVLLSERAFALSRDSLPEGLTIRDLGEHRLKGIPQPEHLHQLVIPGLPADFPPLKTLEVVTTNLPQLLTTFVGRDREVADVVRLMASNRLVTLSGPGGTGKTRLAIQVGSESMEAHPHGVWLVQLAPLSDAALVAPTVATTLGVRELPGRPILDTLIDFLRPKKILLVLDNCEHLVAASAELAHALLRACGDLQILATSREALGVSGEAVYRVPPLSRPDPRRRITPEQLTQFEAVQLFLDRAVSASPSFALTAANANAVRQIVHQLDGIPLAIELAAARIKTLPAEKIAARLGDRFKLLTGGSRTGLTHHQTLRATMDWSHDLLAEPERVLWQRFSVFAGGFTLEAAEAICSGDGIAAEHVLDLLTHLVDKSLIVAEGLNGDVRYHMLETIRQYGREKLVASGQAAGVRSRHLQWYLDLAKQREAELRGPQQMMILDLLEREHDNLRTALEWARISGESADIGLQLAGSLHRFWALRGYLREGREWLEALLQRSSSLSPSTRAKALYGAAVLSFDQGELLSATAFSEGSLSLNRDIGDPAGIALSLNVLGNLARIRGDHAAATAFLEESQSLARQIPDQWALAEALNILGLIARRQGDYKQARLLFAESLALWRQSGDKWGLANSLAHMGVTERYEGNYGRARQLHEESLALRRELGDKLSLASSLNGLGIVAFVQGDYERAEELFQESLELSQELGSKIGVAAALGNLGNVAHRRGDEAQAAKLLEESKNIWKELNDKQGLAAALHALAAVAERQGEFGRSASLYQESLKLNIEIGDKFGIAECVDGLAMIAGARKDGELAARLLGAGEALRMILGTPLNAGERSDHERALAAIRTLLPVGVFEAALDQGRIARLEEVLEEAMAIEVDAGVPGEERV